MGIKSIISADPGACVKTGQLRVVSHERLYELWGQNGNSVYLETEDKNHRRRRCEVAVLEHPQIHYRLRASQLPGDE
jgi:hypothetical protein